MLNVKKGAIQGGFRIACFVTATEIFAICGWAQAPTSTPPSPPPSVPQHYHKPNGPVKEMGKGGEDIGIGVAKGTGELAKGTGDAVGNLARGKVGSAGASFGKGTAELGKNVTVGTAKGLGKLAKGIGGELRRL